jgi:hypothetical protein
VDGGGYMVVDLMYYFEYGGPYVMSVGLDGNGQAEICVDGSTAPGLYEFVAGQSESYPGWISVYASLYIHPAPPPPPVINALGPGCDSGECIWVVGSHFHADSHVWVYSWDWSAAQLFWGPATGNLPDFYYDEANSALSFQITDPTVLASFGNAGVHVGIENSDGGFSGWRNTQSPRPVLTSGGTNGLPCDDLYCIWLGGTFPLDARVDFRIHGQPDVLPDAYTDLGVTPNWLWLHVSPSVRYAYDTAGLDAWVVNPLLANWSASSVYLPPLDRAIIGNIEGISLSGVQYYLNGWACAKTYPGSIALHVYLGGYAGGGGTLAFSGTANVASEPGLSAACNSVGSAFRFSIPIPYSVTQSYGNQSIYVHGISPFGLGNSLIGNSGTYHVPAVDHSITGWVSGVVQENSEYYLRGWACARTYAGSVDVHFYAGGPAGSGTFVTAVTANQATDGSVAAACNSSGTAYGFSILLSAATRIQFGGQTIYVHGISPFGLGNPLIGNSGSQIVPVLDRSVTGSITGIVLENQQYYLRGWACAKTNAGSINVEGYAGGPPGSGALFASVTANLSSNPATTASCNTSGTTYGFSVLLTLALRQQFGGQAIFMRGMSPFGLPNLLIGNSGNMNFPSPVATSSKEYIYIGDRLLAVDTTNLP